MHKRTRALALFLSLTLSPLAASARATTPAPEDVLGFRPGDDRKLAAWASVVAYFKRLDEASDRVRFEELGRTTLGAPFVMATISSPENLRRLDEFKEIQTQLADPRTLGRNADLKARRLITRGKTIVLITCGIHSTEVGSYLSSMLIAHRLASADDPEVRDILRETIVLLVPSLNPDGVDIVKNWYDQTLGTPYEGTEPPALYHKYTGHDNNRDWYAFTQRETQLAVEKIHNVWHPQIVHDIHQMGTLGARLFLPPYTEPVEPNVPKQIVEGYTELGQAMAGELRAAGFKGIVTDAIFDAWTPARAYSHYHGGVRILSETASAGIATPVNVKLDDLRPGRGYDPRKVSDNFPALWPGGEWRLRDVTNYMTAAAFSLLKHAAQNRARWLKRFYEIGKEAVRPRKKGELWGYELLLSKPSNYLLLEYALYRGGVELDLCFTGDHNVAWFVKLAQPYGRFAKALLERQSYPNLRDAAGNPVAPYDVTAHTLSLMTGVEIRPVYAPFRCRQAEWCDDHTLPDYPSPERLGIYKSYVPSMDEGWTRWVVQNNGNAYPYEGVHASRESEPAYSSLEDREVRAGNLRAKYDAIIIPDQQPDAILNGHKPGTMPEEFTGGLGKEGVKRLREFVEEGGTLSFLNRASRFAIEQLHLPVRDVTANLKRTEFYVPGSILSIELDTSHPITKGMPRESIAWVEDSPAFEVEGDAARVRVVARYPQNSDPLLSGWLLGGEKLRGKAALV
ncbi:MAG TPA: M14 metallopeptidase family protein, partial [Pyrinomonadaceae bacterium]|nr:M14 metallopeptidase family protein [Pyrinomonadaceae bacterium]